MMFTFGQMLHASSLEKSNGIVRSMAFASMNSTKVAEQLHQLFKRCVDPTMYAKHLKNWLSFYHASQVSWWLFITSASL